jgi:hypothetical protein
MGVSAALYSGSKCYFFDSSRYVRVTRGETGPGTTDPAYPKTVSREWRWPDGFGNFGIDAAMYSGSKCYFFEHTRYIRVTRGDAGPGRVDPGYPKTIADGWRWPDGFGRFGIDAALYSGSKCYFFDGPRYIRVTRGSAEPWTVDPGYPKAIADGWRWPDGFGRFGIDAALYSGSKCYFFDGPRYIRVTRGDAGPGRVDPGYPKPVQREWRWPAESPLPPDQPRPHNRWPFGGGHVIGVSFKSLLPLATTAVPELIEMQYTQMRRLYVREAGVHVRFGSVEDLSGDPNLSHLATLDIGSCLPGLPTPEQRELFANRNNAFRREIVVYIVAALQGGSGNFLGCATHPDGQPGAAIIPAFIDPWLVAHEAGHVLGLGHDFTSSDRLMWQGVKTNPPPDILPNEVKTMQKSGLSHPA